ncbi:hypothetical protein N7449_008951 [Penicillium cf. viridicatum]|uniref:Secreted protein CSS2 C-terminal domain-containing protein n=1 Tax=Penicillium cf. viridicatum TaxID=2972119 RepID=A0A9W9J954_9EURO|nr:hypothetical protein N7449_008951 [Penicillium cf. viridicatum]
MPSLLDRLPDIARFCSLAGLIIFNSLAYYASPYRPLDDDLLRFNIGASIYLAFIYRWAASTRQMTRDFDHALVERTPIRVCERILAATGSYVVVANFAVAMAKSLASTIKELSDQGSYNTIRGTYESLSWVYHSSGRNCDTTAQQATIAGAIKEDLNDVNGNKLCGTECLRMDHGGTWDRWLKIGPTANFKSNAYCGPSLTFSSCLSGGNNDI